MKRMDNELSIIFWQLFVTDLSRMGHVQMNTLKNTFLTKYNQKRKEKQNQQNYKVSSAVKTGSNFPSRLQN